MKIEGGKPEERGNTVYSNLNRHQDLSDEEVKESGLTHQHAAYDFCGYVWYDKKEGVFREEVWRYHSLADTKSATTIKELVEMVNDEYGYE